MKKRNKCIPCHLHPDPEHWFRKGQSWKAKVAYESEDDALQNRVLYKIIADTCDKYGNMREGQIQDITEAVEKCVAECAKEARKLIDECQPVKFF